MSDAQHPFVDQVISDYTAEILRLRKENTALVELLAKRSQVQLTAEDLPKVCSDEFIAGVHWTIAKLREKST